MKDRDCNLGNNNRRGSLWTDGQNEKDVMLVRDPPLVLKKYRSDLAIIEFRTNFWTTNSASRYANERDELKTKYGSSQ